MADLKKTDEQARLDRALRLLAAAQAAIGEMVAAIGEAQTSQWPMCGPPLLKFERAKTYLGTVNSNMIAAGLLPPERST